MTDLFLNDLILKKIYNWDFKLLFYSIFIILEHLNRKILTFLRIEDPFEKLPLTNIFKTTRFLMIINIIYLVFSIFKRNNFLAIFLIYFT